MRLHWLIVVSLAACTHGGASGPAWPKAAETETDGGESLAPRAAAVASVEATEAKEPAVKDGDDAETPATTPAEPGSTPATTTSPTVTAPDDTITAEEIVIEIEDD